MTTYGPAFYENVRAGARRSAASVVPRVLDLVRPFSVIDVGCGDGTWLAEFRRRGIVRTLGVDGSYVDQNHLAIPAENFRPHDLQQPLVLDPTFDLAVSLEVAEHLPAASAPTFVASLTALAPVVLFSAAIPFQRGVNHVNEQWPDYWIARFAEVGFTMVDCMRHQLWTDDSVEWWYVQNMFLFVRSDLLQPGTALQNAWDEARARDLPVRLIHPRAYLSAADENTRVQESAREMFRLAGELAPHIPAGASFILVDDAQFEAWAVPPGRRALPFLERDGVYWGPPADDATARLEMDRMRSAGATHIVIGWTAFWWLDFYAEFVLHLRTHHRCVLENPRGVVFDLR